MLKMLKNRLISIMLLLSVELGMAVAGDMTTYCQTPPFITAMVPSNIMIVLQDDARMRWRAYCEDNNGDGICDNHYDNNKVYDGYFDPSKNYKWNNNRKYWEETTSFFSFPSPCPDTTSVYPAVYSETVNVINKNATLKYAVIPGSFRIYSKQYRDDGNGNILDKNNATVGRITYSNPNGVGYINFFRGDIDGQVEVYYSYNMNTNNIYSGSCLNFHYMSRIDIVRLAFTGGSPKSCPTNQTADRNYAKPEYCDPRINNVDKEGNSYIVLKPQDFENWNLRWQKDVCFNDSNNCIKFYIFPGPAVKSLIDRVYSKGILYDLAKKDVKPRFGLITYDTAYPVIHPNKVYIGDYRKSLNDADYNYPYKNLITSLNANRDLFDDIEQYWWNSKRANIWDAGNSMAPTLWDVYRYFKQDYPMYAGLAPSTSNDDKWKDPKYQYINNSLQFVPCAQNFVLLLTEGMWNIGSNSNGDLIKTCKIDDGFENYSSDPVVPVRHMIRENLITATYVINVWPYSNYGKNAAKLIAHFGSSNPKSNFPSGFNSYPDTTCDLSEYNSDFKQCKGSLCYDTSSLNPDTYFQAASADELLNAIKLSVTNILKKASSSSSVSVISERSTKGSIIAQAVFYPQKEFSNGEYKVNWVGQLFTYWYFNTLTAQNIREDTNKDKKLSIQDDNIIEFTTDSGNNLRIDVFSSDPAGRKSSLIKSLTSLDQINYLFEVGENLKNRQYNDRKIYISSCNNCLLSNNPLIEFKSSNVDSFKELLGTDPSLFPSCLKDSNNNIKYKDLVDYVLGKNINGCRSKLVDSNGNTWKLGDIIYSSPKIVDYNDYSVIYTASNDGILHAIKVGKLSLSTDSNYVSELKGTDIGKELWGFIPSHALPYLRFLADPNYCHIYMNDLSPYIVDVDLNNDGNKEKVLIGGMRLGGACANVCLSNDPNNCLAPVNPPADTCSNPNSDGCIGLSEYYALDITDPENPKLLWEFTDKDLGFSYSGPGVIKTKNNNYVVFASGPINYKAQFANNDQKSLYIYILDLSSGKLIRKINTGIQKAFAGRIFSTGLDYNEDGYTDFLAIGYSRQDGSVNNFKGGVLILGSIKNNKLRPFDGINWDFVDYRSLGTDIGPVTAKVEFMKCFNRWYMYLGTGRWFFKTDNSETNKNTIFGVPVNIVSDNYGDYFDLNTGTQDVTDEKQVNNICTDASNNVIRGWYINLDQNEKVITDPSIGLQNVILFTSMKPNQDLCGMGGDTRVWTLNCATGGNLNNNCNGTYFVTVPSNSNLLLQLSGGDIQQINISNTSNSRVSDYYKGTPPENAPPIAGGSNPKKEKGRIILWIEK